MTLKPEPSPGRNVYDQSRNADLKSTFQIS